MRIGLYNIFCMCFVLVLQMMQFIWKY